MYNHLYKYLKENDILHEIQFGFQSGYSTNDAIVQLVDKIFYSFEKEQLILRVFINLSFHQIQIIYHFILLKTLSFYGITDKTHAWFLSYLSTRKQYIHMSENSKTDLKYVTCGVSQGFILVPLLFLVYANNPPTASRLLDSTNFTDGILTFSLIIRTLNTS